MARVTSFSRVHRGRSHPGPGHRGRRPPRSRVAPLRHGQGLHRAGDRGRFARQRGRRRRQDLRCGGAAAGAGCWSRRLDEAPRRRWRNFDTSRCRPRLRPTMKLFTGCGDTMSSTMRRPPPPCGPERTLSPGPGPSAKPLLIASRAFSRSMTTRSGLSSEKTAWRTGALRSSTRRGALRPDQSRTSDTWQPRQHARRPWHRAPRARTARSIAGAAEPQCGVIYRARINNPMKL